MFIFRKIDIKYVLCVLFFIHMHSPAVYDVRTDAIFITVSKSVKIDIFQMGNIERLFAQERTLSHLYVLERYIFDETVLFVQAIA